MNLILRTLSVILLVCCVALSLVVGQLYDFELLAWAPVVATSAVSIIWFFSGRRPETWLNKIRTAINNRVFASNCRLFLLTLLIAVLTRSLFLATIGSELISLVPTRPLQVAILEDGRSIGGTTQEKPLNLRFASGHHVLTGKADGIEDVKVEFTAGWSSPFRKSARIVDVPVTLINDITFSQIDISPDMALTTKDFQEKSKDKISYPPELANTPSVTIGFSLQSSRRVPTTIQNIEADVSEVKECSEWHFPYFGEPKGKFAIEIDGYVLLRSIGGQYPLRFKEHPSLGKDAQPAFFNVRVFADPGHTYVLKLKEHWIDEGDQKQTGESESDPITLTFLRSWVSLVQAGSTVKIQYYSRVNKLVDQINANGLLERCSIIDTDSVAREVAPLEWPRETRSKVKIVNDASIAQWIQILGKNPNQPYRPLNCFLVDNQKLLVQKVEGNTMDRAQLIADPTLIERVKKQFATDLRAR